VYPYYIPLNFIVMHSNNSYPAFLFLKRFIFTIDVEFI
jgi:hypothetical protein